MKLVHVAPIKTWIRFERGTKEQTEHLQTGLMRTVPRPQIRTAQPGPIRSALLAQRTKRATDGLSGSPAAGLTCALPLRTWVCEVGDEEDVLDLQKRLKKAGVDLPHLERANGGDTTRTLALLSRFPIVARDSQRTLSYKMGDQTMPFQRGILDATVEFHPGLQVRFLGAHLKSMREVTEGDQNLMRRNEAHLLRNHIDNIMAKNTQARILCYGDFNEHRNEPAIAEIMGSRASDGYMNELILRDVNGQVWTHYWDAADSYSRLDYVFSSRALRPLIDLRSCRIHHERDFDAASDHRPLVIKIKDRL